MDEASRALVFGSYDAALHPRVAVLRDGLAARGWRVTELNEPLGATTADKVAAAGSLSATAKLAGRQLRSVVRLAWRSRAVDRPDVVLVGYMGHFDIHLARILFRGRTIVLDHLVGLSDTVKDRGLGGGLKLHLLDLVDRAALRAADLVVVDTELQAETLPDSIGVKAVVVPVGASRTWFEAAGAEPSDADNSGQPMRVVFFGLYTPLQGAPTIGSAIALLRDDPITFTMIGHGQDFNETKTRTHGSARVQWMDWVDSGQLPQLVADHDVCLGIFGTSPKAQRVIPTKVYQGLAAGCAVVTGDTAAIRELGDAVVTVPPGDPASLAATLRHLASDKESLSMARHRARSAAGRFSPEASTGALDDHLTTRTQEGRLPPLTLSAWLRWDVIQRELERTRARDVLEVGPGEGAAACRLAVGRQYTGLEISERARGIAERRLADRGTPGRLVGSFQELAQGEQFDLVCAFEVIEHIEDDRAALAEWFSRVRPGGTLIISTPAGPDRLGPADLAVGHFRRYVAKDLENLAKEVGFDEVRVTHTGYPIGYALEAVRNQVARRKLAKRDAAELTQSDVAEFTEKSSSFLQPPQWSGAVTRAVSVPGRWLQRRRPDRGTGLVLIARVPG